MYALALIARLQVDLGVMNPRPPTRSYARLIALGLIAALSGTSPALALRPETDRAGLEEALRGGHPAAGAPVRPAPVAAHAPPAAGLEEPLTPAARRRIQQAVADGQDPFAPAWGQTLEETIRPAVQAWLLRLAQQMSRSRVPLVRQAATTALGLRSEPEALEALLTLARDDDGTVRQAAATALGLRSEPDALAALRTLAQDYDPAVRQAAATAFGARLPMVLLSVVNRAV